MEDFVKTSRGTVLLSEAARRNQRLLGLFKIGDDRHSRRQDSTSKSSRSRDKSSNKGARSRPKSLYDFKVRYDYDDAKRTPKTAEYSGKESKRREKFDRRDFHGQKSWTMDAEDSKDYRARLEASDVGNQGDRSINGFDSQRKDPQFSCQDSTWMNDCIDSSKPHFGYSNAARTMQNGRDSPSGSGRKELDTIDMRGMRNDGLFPCKKARTEYRRSTAPDIRHRPSSWVEAKSSGTGALEVGPQRPDGDANYYQLVTGDCSPKSLEKDRKNSARESVSSSSNNKERLRISSVKSASFDDSSIGAKSGTGAEIPQQGTKEQESCRASSYGESREKTPQKQENLGSGQQGIGSSWTGKAKNNTDSRNRLISERKEELVSAFANEEIKFIDDLLTELRKLDELSAEEERIKKECENQCSEKKDKTSNVCEGGLMTKTGSEGAMGDADSVVEGPEVKGNEASKGQGTFQQVTGGDIEVIDELKCQKVTDLCVEQSQSEETTAAEKDFTGQEAIDHSEGIHGVEKQDGISEDVRGRELAVEEIRDGKDNGMRAGDLPFEVIQSRMQTVPRGDVRKTEIENQIAMGREIEIKQTKELLDQDKSSKDFEIEEVKDEKGKTQNVEHEEVKYPDATKVQGEVGSDEIMTRKILDCSGIDAFQVDDGAKTVMATLLERNQEAPEVTGMSREIGKEEFHGGVECEGDCEVMIEKNNEAMSVLSVMSPTVANNALETFVHQPLIEDRMIKCPGNDSVLNSMSDWTKNSNMITRSNDQYPSSTVTAKADDVNLITCSDSDFTNSYKNQAITCSTVDFASDADVMSNEKRLIACIDTGDVGALESSRLNDSQATPFEIEDSCATLPLMTCLDSNDMNTAGSERNRESHFLACETENAIAAREDGKKIEEAKALSATDVQNDLISQKTDDSVKFYQVKERPGGEPLDLTACKEDPVVIQRYLDSIDHPSSEVFQQNDTSAFTSPRNQSKHDSSYASSDEISVKTEQLAGHSCKAAICEEGSEVDLATGQFSTMIKAIETANIDCNLQLSPSTATVIPQEEGNRQHGTLDDTRVSNDSVTAGGPRCFFGTIAEGSLLLNGESATIGACSIKDVFDLQSVGNEATTLDSANFSKLIDADRILCSTSASKETVTSYDTVDVDGITCSNAGAVDDCTCSNASAVDDCTCHKDNNNKAITCQEPVKMETIMCATDFDIEAITNKKADVGENVTCPNVISVDKSTCSIADQVEAFTCPNIEATKPNACSNSDMMFSNSDQKCAITSETPSDSRPVMYPPGFKPGDIEKQGGNDVDVISFPKVPVLKDFTRRQADINEDITCLESNNQDTTAANTAKAIEGTNGGSKDGSCVHDSVMIAKSDPLVRDSFMSRTINESDARTASRQIPSDLHSKSIDDTIRAISSVQQVDEVRRKSLVDVVDDSANVGQNISQETDGIRNFTRDFIIENIRDDKEGYDVGRVNLVENAGFSQSLRGKVDNVSQDNELLPDEQKSCSEEKSEETGEAKTVCTLNENSQLEILFGERNMPDEDESLRDKNSKEVIADKLLCRGEKVEQKIVRNFGSSSKDFCQIYEHEEPVSNESVAMQPCLADETVTDDQVQHQKIVKESLDQRCREESSLEEFCPTKDTASLQGVEQQERGNISEEQNRTRLRRKQLRKAKSDNKIPDGSSAAERGEALGVEVLKDRGNVSFDSGLKTRQCSHQPSKKEADMRSEKMYERKCDEKWQIGDTLMTSANGDTFEECFGKGSHANAIYAEDDGIKELACKIGEGTAIVGLEACTDSGGLVKTIEKEQQEKDKAEEFLKCYLELEDTEIFTNFDARFAILYRSLRQLNLASALRKAGVASSFVDDEDSSKRLKRRYLFSEEDFVNGNVSWLQKKEDDVVKQAIAAEEGRIEIDKGSEESKDFEMVQGIELEPRDEDLMNNKNKGEDLLSMSDNISIEEKQSLEKEISGKLSIFLEEERKNAERLIQEKRLNICLAEEVRGHVDLRSGEQIASSEEESKVKKNGAEVVAIDYNEASNSNENIAEKDVENNGTEEENIHARNRGASELFEPDSMQNYDISGGFLHRINDDMFEVRKTFERECEETLKEESEDARLLRQTKPDDVKMQQENVKDEVKMVRDVLMEYKKNEENGDEKCFEKKTRGRSSLERAKLDAEERAHEDITTLENGTDSRSEKTYAGERIGDRAGKQRDSERNTVACRSGHDDSLEKDLNYEHANERKRCRDLQHDESLNETCDDSLDKQSATSLVEKAGKRKPSVKSIWDDCKAILEHFQLSKSEDAEEVSETATMDSKETTDFMKNRTKEQKDQEVQHNECTRKSECKGLSFGDEEAADEEKLEFAKTRRSRGQFKDDDSEENQRDKILVGLDVADQTELKHDMDDSNLSDLNSEGRREALRGTCDDAGFKDFSVVGEDLRKETEGNLVLKDDGTGSASERKRSRYLENIAEQEVEVEDRRMSNQRGILHACDEINHSVGTRHALSGSNEREARNKLQEIDNDENSNENLKRGEERSRYSDTSFEDCRTEKVDRDLEAVSKDVVKNSEEDFNLGEKSEDASKRRNRRSRYFQSTVEDGQIETGCLGSIYAGQDVVKNSEKELNTVEKTEDGSKRRDRRSRYFQSTVEDGQIETDCIGSIYAGQDVVKNSEKELNTVEKTEDGSKRRDRRSRYFQSTVEDGQIETDCIGSINAVQDVVKNSEKELNTVEKTEDGSKRRDRRSRYFESTVEDGQIETDCIGSIYAGQDVVKNSEKELNTVEKTEDGSKRRDRRSRYFESTVEDGQIETACLGSIYAGQDVVKNSEKESNTVEKTEDGSKRRDRRSRYFESTVEDGQMNSEYKDMSIKVLSNDDAKCSVQDLNLANASEDGYKGRNRRSRYFEEGTEMVQGTVKAELSETINKLTEESIPDESAYKRRRRRRSEYFEEGTEMNQGTVKTELSETISKLTEESIPDQCAYERRRRRRSEYFEEGTEMNQGTVKTELSETISKLTEESIPDQCAYERRRRRRSEYFERGDDDKRRESRTSYLNGDISLDKDKEIQTTQVSLEGDENIEMQSNSLLGASETGEYEALLKTQSEVLEWDGETFGDVNIVGKEKSTGQDTAEPSRLDAGGAESSSMCAGDVYNDSSVGKGLESETASEVSRIAGKESNVEREASETTHLDTIATGDSCSLAKDLAEGSCDARGRNAEELPPACMESDQNEGSIEREATSNSAAQGSITSCAADIREEDSSTNGDSASLGKVDRKLQDDTDSCDGYYINNIEDPFTGYNRRGEYSMFRCYDRSDRSGTGRLQGRNDNLTADLHGFESKMRQIKQRMRQLVDRNKEMEERIEYGGREDDVCEDNQWQYFLQQNKLLQLAVSKLWQKEGFDSSRLMKDDDKTMYRTGYNSHKTR